MPRSGPKIGTANLFIDLPPGNCASGDHDAVLWEYRSPTDSGGNIDWAIFDTYQRGKAMCQGCPILEQCEAVGMDEENRYFGLWGGMLAGERVILKAPQSTSEVAQVARNYRRVLAYERKHHDGREVWCEQCGERFPAYRGTFGFCPSCAYDRRLGRRHRINRKASA